MTQDRNDSMDDVLYKTIVDGKFAVSLDETVETADVELFDEDQAAGGNDALELHIQVESILSKLDIDSKGRRKNRYHVEEELAPDTNSSVFTVTDENLNRSVTVKVAMSDHDQQLDNAHKLIHEALIVSYFDHPGIPPVYDLEFSDNQQIYCTMKKVNGTPLSEIAGQSTDAVDDAYIQKFDTIGKITDIFIKVCETMAYAHDHAVVHRNIKPEKIVIGAHGEVYIVGWDAAIDLEHDEQDLSILCGTPLYMSPEQALCKAIDYRSDIYSIGASLFHVLFKQPHVKRDDFDAFWQAKLDGAIDLLDEEESRSIPEPLVNICMKCLQKNPDERYQNCAELLRDLEIFREGSIDGNAVSDEDAVNKTVMIVSLGIILLLLALNVFHFIQSKSDLWGEAVYRNTFEYSNGEDSNWREDFETRKGGFIEEDGYLRSQGGPDFYLFYREPVFGPVAIEFDGKMLPGSQAGDLSVVYCPDIHAEARGERLQYYFLQNGAYANAGSTIAGPQGQLDFTPFKLEHGVTYRIRAEIDERKLRLYVDGELKCAYDLIFPLNSGYVGIYAYHDDKIIDNIAIYQKRQQQRSVDLQIADALLENGAFHAALQRYSLISKKDNGSEGLKDELSYKIGLCHYKLNEVKRAYILWDQVSGKEYAMAVNFFKWEELSRQGAYDELLKQMYYKHRSPDELARKSIRYQWSIFLKRLSVAGDEDLIREFINFRQVNFPESRLYSNNILGALTVIGEAGKALEMFPEQDIIVVKALTEMGEYDRVINEYPHLRYSVANALLLSGQYQKIIDDYADIREMLFEAMVALGKLDEIEDRFADDETYLNRLAAVRGEYMRLNDGQNSPPYIYDKKLTEVLNAYFAGQASVEEVAAVIDSATGDLKYSVSRCIQIYLLKGMLEHIEGRPELLKTTLHKIWNEKRQMMGMRLWYGVGVILGNIDQEAFLSQPRQQAAQGDYYIFKALHEDLYGSKPKALEGYRRYLAAPSHERYSNRALTAFAEARISALD